MRLLPYYIFHTFVNAVKKLLRTWVSILLIFMLVCALMGGLIGIVIGTAVEKNTPGTSETDNASRSMTPEQREVAMDIVEVVSGGIILLMLVWNVYSADKAAAARSNGKKTTALFTMPDVNFLFPSPEPPQTILLFRTILQMGLLLVGSLYLVFQLPNLIFNLGMSWQSALCLLAAWGLLLMTGKLINLFFYSVTATRPSLKKILLPISLGILTAAVAVYIAHYLATGDPWQSARALFASEASRYIPVWGWLKGIIAFAAEGRWIAVALCALGCLIVILLMIRLIWSIKVDFYEDALQGASEHFKRQEEIKAGKAAAKRHKESEKDRAARQIGRGEGASVLFFKGWAVRRHSAAFGLLTGMTWIYLAAAILPGTLQSIVLQSRTPALIGGIFAMILFFAGFGDPIAVETSRDVIYLMPEAPWKKLFWSLLYSLTDAALAFLPAFWIGCAILRAPVWEAAVWSLLLAALALYNSAGGLLVSQLLPSSLTPVISSLIQVMVRMLLIFPPVILILFGIIFDFFTLSLFFAALLLTAGGVIFFLPCPVLLKSGKR